MDLDNLELEVKKSSRFILLAMFSAPLSYLVWFSLHGQTMSTSTADWGTFGDFIGGVLNPLVAFFAFYWLTKSIKIQKEELSETKNALRDTSEEQKEQTRLNLLSIKIQSLNLELGYINTKMTDHNSYINQLATQAQNKGINYTVVTNTGENKKIEDILPSLHKIMQELSNRQQEILSEIDIISKQI